MPRVNWTPRALRSVKAARDFLYEKSPEAAVKAVLHIQERVNLLEGHPEAGRPVERLGAEYRELVIPFGASGYLFLYRLQNDEVTLLVLRHQKQAGYNI